MSMQEINAEVKAARSDRSDPREPAKYSNGPDYQPGGRPRSSNVVIRKVDGGVIGT